MNAMFNLIQAVTATEETLWYNKGLYRIPFCSGFSLDRFSLDKLK